MINHQKGFTLIEIMAVIVILGIVTSIAVWKLYDAPEGAYDLGFERIVQDLNNLEIQIWTNAKLSGESLTDEEILAKVREQFDQLDDSMVLKFKNRTKKAIRTPSSKSNYGVWKLQ
jgi:prepilin-type N-terminal cleavage/methylation domain-containing protein